MSIKPQKEKAFTLVELLVVIAILAVLIAIVIVALNPVELLKQGRDSRRLTDLYSLNQALNYSYADNLSMGNASTVYISIPDNSAPTSNCPTLSSGLPALPNGWVYQCSNSANYLKVDSTGWVPVNFNSTTLVSNPLSQLPVDPVNTTSTGLYYTYVNGSWELTASLESSKYQTKYASSQGGTSSSTYQIGNHIGVTPSILLTRYSGSGGGGSGGGGGSPVVPTITTSAATSITSSGGLLNGSITNEGNASSTVVGFDYGTTTSYGSQVTSTYSGGTSSFLNTVADLTANTTYHFRAKAQNSAGWGYGSDQTLSTGSLDSYTSLLLHMDGINGSTNFIDQTGKTVTTYGSAQLDTSQQKFGTASGKLNVGSSNSCVSVPIDSSLQFGSNDFTIDFWVNFSSVSSNMDFVRVYDNSWPYDNWDLVYDTVNGIGAYIYAGTGGTILPWTYFPYTFSINNWYHVAFIRHGSTVTTYVNGSSIGSASISGSFYTASAGTVFPIGYSLKDSAGGLTGWIDEFRVSNGIARWTSNFTPPTAPY